MSLKFVLWSIASLEFDTDFAILSADSSYNLA